MGATKTKLLFTVSDADIDSQENINRELIKSSLFILPKNDGEAVRACQILVGLKAPHLHISRQNWGATLEQEWPRLELSQYLSRGIKRLVIFEIPGLSDPSGTSIPKEEFIKSMGLEVVIIDHHHYHWVDRHRPISSLEQLCRLIGWEMSPTDKAIAINDRSYIPGLKNLGLSVEQIRRIRLFDLENQGNSRRYIEKQLQIARGLFPELQSKKKGDLWILDEPHYKQPYIIQELAISSTSGLLNAFEIKPHKLGFTGNPQIVDLLVKRDFSQWESTTGPLICYGGGDPHTSKFWGVKTVKNRKTMSDEMAQTTLDFIIENLKII